jgi:hypothetical protein
VSQTIPIPKSSNLSCAESAQKIACHLFKIFLRFCCLGWKLLCVRLLCRFMNSIVLLVTDRNLFNRFQVSGRLRLVLIRDGLFFLAHERRQKCVEFGTANKRVKCKEFCRIVQNGLKRDGIHTVHNTECMQKTRFQLRKRRGKKQEKKRKTGRNNSKWRSPAICPRIFLSSYPYCRRVQCLVETL